MAADDRQDDAWDDFTPEDEARFFGPSRFSGLGCTLAILIVIAVGIAMFIAAIVLLHSVRDAVTDLTKNME